MFSEADGVKGDAIVVDTGIGVAQGDGAAEHLHQLDVSLQKVRGELDQFPVEGNDDGIQRHRRCQGHEHDQCQGADHLITNIFDGLVVNLIHPLEVAGQAPVLLLERQEHMHQHALVEEGAAVLNPVIQGKQAQVFLQLFDEDLRTGRRGLQDRLFIAVEEPDENEMPFEKLPGLLPQMSEEEALESAAMQSLSSMFDVRNWKVRPYRAPHHTASAVAMVGGGSNPRPGEISVAMHGVLFLDELPEFARPVLEVLREPLESGRITISRAARRADFRAQFQLVAAMNP